MRRALLAVLVVTIVGWIAAAALYATEAEAAPAATAAGDVPIAEEFWGGPPPQCTSVTFMLDTSPSESGWATEPLPGWTGPCELKVHEVGDVGANGVTFTAEYICLAAIHEEGHLHGEGHSTDPLNIMFGGPAPLSITAAPVCAEPLAAAPLPQHHRRHRAFRRGQDISARARI